MLIIELIENEILNGFEGARRISGRARSGGCTYVGLALTPDEINCLAQVGFAKWLNMEWSPTVAEPGKVPDKTKLAKVAGCRVRGSKNDQPLYIYKNDEDDVPVVSAKVNLPFVYLYGWVLGSEGKKFYFDDYLGKPAHVVGRFSLKSMQTLPTTRKQQ